MEAISYYSDAVNGNANGNCKGNCFDTVLGNDNGNENVGDTSNGEQTTSNQLIYLGIMILSWWRGTHGQSIGYLRTRSQLGKLAGYKQGNIIHLWLMTSNGRENSYMLQGHWYCSKRCLEKNITFPGPNHNLIFHFIKPSVQSAYSWYLWSNLSRLPGEICINCLAGLIVNSQKSENKIISCRSGYSINCYEPLWIRVYPQQVISMVIVLGTASRQLLAMVMETTTMVQKMPETTTATVSVGFSSVYFSSDGFFHWFSIRPSTGHPKDEAWSGARNTHEELTFTIELRHHSNLINPGHNNLELVARQQLSSIS